jgi:pSer/pThr/pTyr-binding forkhead associated (FHA) protein
VYCSECGFQNGEAANFCAKCGTLLVPDEPSAQTTISFSPADVESAQVAADADTPTLVIRSGGGRGGEHLPLVAARETIGRTPDADLFLDDITVSREHAVIERGDDGVYISDLGSLNGTYVNRQRVVRQRLADGDEVQIGKFKLTFLER